MSSSFCDDEKTARKPWCYIEPHLKYLVFKNSLWNRGRIVGIILMLLKVFGPIVKYIHLNWGKSFHFSNMMGLHIVSDNA
jgi:hypothetical protein